MASLSKRINQSSFFVLGSRFGEIIFTDNSTWTKCSG